MVRLAGAGPEEVVLDPMCGAATIALAFVRPGLTWGPLIALILFVIADMSFEIGNVFYNAFLTSIASPERIGRVSGYGWGLGYVGGMVCMGVALVGFVLLINRWMAVFFDAIERRDAIPHAIVGQRLAQEGHERVLLRGTRDTEHGRR